MYWEICPPKAERKPDRDFESQSPRGSIVNLENDGRMPSAKTCEVLGNPVGQQYRQCQIQSFPADYERVFVSMLHKKTRDMVFAFGILSKVSQEISLEQLES